MATLIIIAFKGYVSTVYGLPIIQTHIIETPIYPDIKIPSLLPNFFYLSSHLLAPPYLLRKIIEILKIKLCIDFDAGKRKILLI